MENHKKIKNIIIVVIILIGFVTVFFTIKSYSNKDIKEYREVNKIDSKRFKLYLEQENGEYSESNSGWPSSGYSLNQLKTVCVDNDGNSIGDALSYKNGTLYLTTKKSVFCNVYFDIKADIVISVSTDGNSGELPTLNGYKATLSCDTATASFSQKYQRVEISSVTSDEVKCTLNYTKDTNSYTSLKSKVESSANTQANGYRYSGKSPNNYIWFNNEMWRIIGSIPTKQSDGTTANLVKIIRDDLIGTLVFDATEDKNYEWGQNTLYTILNTHFYASSEENLDGQNSSGCYSFIADSPWEGDGKGICDYSEIGILSTSYYGKMIEQVYWNTGSSSATVSTGTAYTNETATQTVKGYVGLMSASDYGYAASSAYHSTNLSAYSGAAASSDWLYKYADELTLSELITYVDRGRHSGGGSGYLSTMGVYGNYKIRPVVYLNSDIYVISGTGSASDPYIIGM